MDLHIYDLRVDSNVFNDLEHVEILINNKTLLASESPCMITDQSSSEHSIFTNASEGGFIVHDVHFNSVIIMKLNINNELYSSQQIVLNKDSKSIRFSIFCIYDDHTVLTKSVSMSYEYSEVHSLDNELEIDEDVQICQKYFGTLDSYIYDVFYTLLFKDGREIEDVDINLANYPPYNIGDEGIYCLCNYIKEEQIKVKELNLAKNKLTDQSIQYLITILGSSFFSSLNSLILSENEITENGLKIFFEFLIKECYESLPIRILSLSGLNCSDQVMKLFSECIDKELFEDLDELWLKDSSISEQGFDFLIHSLIYRHLSPSSLGFSGVKFTLEMCNLLSVYFEQYYHPHEVNLSLSNCNFTDDLMQKLLHSLFSMNYPIHTLSIQSNPITMDTFNYLFETLLDQSVMYIKELSLQHILPRETLRPLKNKLLDKFEDMFIWI